jgi:glutamyl-tRNA synthetase
MDELIKQFSIDKVGKSGAKFDPEKARWFNHYYIQKQSIEELGNSFKKILESKNISPDRFSPETINEIILLVKERANFIQDLWEHSDFFFISPSKYDEVVVKKYWKADTPSHLEEIINILSACEPFKSNVIDEKIKTFIHSKALGMGQIMNTLRIALVGSSKGPGLAVIAEILGKDEVIRRILKAIDTIKL